MLDEQEIAKRLEDVPPKLCKFFAIRCSLRILPYLVSVTKNSQFSNWDEIERLKFILAILSAQQVSINFSVFESKKDLETIVLGANISGKVKIFAKAINNIMASEYALIIASAVDASMLNHVKYSAITAFNSKQEAHSAFQMRIDLNVITSNHATPPFDFFYSPLWSITPPESWRLHSMSFIESLVGLDAGFDVWADWYQDRINGVPLNKELEQKWLNIPKEIREQGVKATNAYLATLVANQKEDNLKPLNLVRAIFIGNGAAGKTSLIRKLMGEPVVEGKEDMTAGIEIREWSIPNSEIKARFWDFGGQVMSHSTHQFFLRERCLYVLVVDAGTEREIRENQSANEQAEYWLEHIKAFGNNASVMLVGNKCDKVPVHLDMNALTEKYPNIIGFYPLSCISEAIAFKHDFEKFQAILGEQLNEVGTGQVMFTSNQFEVLEEVRRLSRKHAFLAYEKFDSLCVEHEIGKQGLDQTAYLGLLDALGEIIHFPDLQWSDAYVLNPRWLTYGVYTLLYSKEVELQQGILSRVDVVSILQAEKVEDEQGNQLTYPKSKCGFIVDAMTQFKLCYELQQGGYYVIPDKLPEEQPDLSAYFDKKAEGTLAFEFDFSGLLPRNIMPNLIVARHKEIIKDKSGKQLVWQRGVVLFNEAHQASARWTVDYTQGRLQLWIQGKEAREYLLILRDKVNEILSSIKGLSVNEYVLLPEQARSNTDDFRLQSKVIEKITYKNLIEQAKAGRETVFSDVGNQYDLQQVMGFIMTDEQQKKEGVGSVNYDMRGATIGALGGVGNKHKVSGKVTIKSSDKKDISDLQNALGELMQHVQNHDADFEIKANAYGELKQIREHLDDLENASLETKGKLRDLLTSVKDGSLGAIKLGTEIKEANELMTWIGEKTVLVSAFLAAMPV